ncbi:MAG: YesL family protein [Lachnospiraceae bacterium]|nr:YesL family protein [Lachnospiraceae bacterium]
MKDFFSFDSSFFRMLDKLGSLFILNLLTLVCSIPIVTVGASFTALYYVTMKMVRDEETYVIKDFFRSFRQNFLQGTAIWMILLVIASVLVYDYRLMALNPEAIPGAKVFTILIMACSVFYALELAFVFPVLAKFYNTVRQTMKNALFMGIRHFPKTVAIIFIDVIFLVITIVGLYRNGRSFVAPLYVCLGFAVPAYANSYILVKIFDQYIPEEDVSCKELETGVAIEEMETDSSIDTGEYGKEEKR